MERNKPKNTDFGDIVSNFVKQVTYELGGAPENVRQKLIDLLTGLVANPVEFENYMLTLVEELQSTGNRLPFLQKDWDDIPDDIIAESGFQNLSYKQLLDYATSPEALEAIRDFLMDEDTQRGQWFFDALFATASEEDKERLDVRSGFNVVARPHVNEPR